MISIYPVSIKGEVGKGFDLAPAIVESARDTATGLQDGDVVVVTQKVVSKAEGAIVHADHDDRAAIAKIVEGEAVRVLRRRGNFMIVQTRHGFVCANAGLDSSNVEEGTVTLLPRDPDQSARRIRTRIHTIAGVDVAVIISDTFGRPWRIGQTDIAIGVAGMLPMMNYAGTKDTFGATLRVTNIAVADELAGAAEMVMGKALGVPAAVVRGAPFKRGRGNARQILRPLIDDLFR